MDGRTAGLAAGDFNGDGRQDLLAVNSAESLLQGHRDPVLAVLFPGNGDGTFAAAQRFQIGVGSLPERIHAVDINGDGRLDVAGNYPFSSLVLLGNGDGTFQGPVFSQELRGTLATFVDWSGDRRLDVITAETMDPNLAAAGSSRIDVFAGNGDGTFTLVQCIVVGVVVQALVAADLNGDGAVDPASANMGFTDVSVVLGYRDGGFVGFEGGTVDFATGFQPFALAGADLNGDGRPDLTVINRGSRFVSVLLGNGDGTFQPERRVAATAGEFPVLADFNRDGRVDVANANGGTAEVSVVLGTGDGTFGPERDIVLGNGVLATSLLAADLNGDHAPDLAATDYLSGVRVLLGNGDGTFQPASSVSIGSYPQDLLAADFDADGLLDLVAPTDFPGRVLSVALGNGDGTFQAPRSFGAGLAPIAIAAADLNGDGAVDLAAANTESRDLSVLLGNGDGTFQAERRFARGTEGFALIAADFNVDGRTDLATAYLGDVSIFLNKLGADWESPRMMCPEAMDVRCTGPEGAVVSFAALAEDRCDPDPSVICDPAPGSLLPLGTTLVTCTARDASGNRSQCRFEVTVTCGGRQLPGDSSQDGAVDISDAISLLGFLFLGSPSALPCGDGTADDPANEALVDWNGDGGVDLSDAVGLLGRLFLGGPLHTLGAECLEIDDCPEACGP
jgi:hypothetical protein